MGGGERSIRDTLDHLLEGFQIISPEWRYLYVNPAAAEHGRTTPQALEGRMMMEAYPGIEQTPLFDLLTRCMKERIAERLENRFEFADAAPRWFELHIEPVPDGLCIHSIDIDDRKRAEDALVAMNHDLERRVADRTAELEQANRELDAFSYSVAHDLRGPLRTIDGFARILEEEANDVLTAANKVHLDRVRVAARRMSTLIDDLLALSRITRADLVRRECSLTDVARAVAAELVAHEPERKVTWHIADGLTAFCDPSLARIVLENLLGNAWKFTAGVAEPRIEVMAAEEAGSVAVVDNGVGFDMAFSARLFEPFERLHPGSSFPGTGIGLSIVDRIVRRHGGLVRGDGAVGHGARFVFTLEPSR